MKLAITGKGGVGKTTTASLLAKAYAAEGFKVIAIDANPDANFAMALGFAPEEYSKITPVAEMKDLIEERTGAKAGSSGGMFKMNPKVDDIPEKFALKKDNIMLLVMGTVKKGESGCMCPESALIKSLVSHLVFKSSEVVIMDMDAGVEHMGRGTAKAVDAFIIVVEPGQRSFQTARLIRDLAADMGIKNIYVVGSKTKNENDRQFIKDSLSEFKVLGFIDYNMEIAEADKLGKSVYDTSPTAIDAIKKIKNELDKLKNN